MHLEEVVVIGAPDFFTQAHRFAVCRLWPYLFVDVKVVLGIQLIDISVKSSSTLIKQSV